MSKSEKIAAETINALRRGGKTRPEIATILGVSLSKVKRILSSVDAEPRATKAAAERARPKQRVREKQNYVDPEEGEGLMERAKVVLGARMGEKHGCYTLDGLPTSSWSVLKAAGLSVNR